MRYTLRLIQITEPHNKKLIVKRLVSDMGVDFNKADSLVERLPLDVMHGIKEEDIQKTILDYERLGCRMSKISEKEERREPLLKSEPPRSIPITSDKRVTLTAKTSPGPIKFSVHTPEKPSKGRSNKKLAAQYTILAVIVVLIIVAIYYSSKLKVNKVGQFSGNHGLISSGKGALTEMSPQDEEAEKQAETSDSALSTDEKEAILRKALDKAPENEIVKQKMSSVYEEKASHELTPEGCIRFYQMAIGLNPYNESAWDGLIQAYQDYNMNDKAIEAGKEKEIRFREAHLKLNKLLNSFGTLEGIPKISGNMIYLAYRFPNSDDAGIEREMRRMASRIRGLKKFESITIKVIMDRGEVVREF